MASLDTRLPAFVLGLTALVTPAGAQEFDAPLTELPGLVLGSAIADFDMDGRDEVVAAFLGYSATSGFALLDWDGGFGLTVSSTTTSTPLPGSIVAGDWNGDGFPDVAVEVNTFARVYDGNGSGAFTLSTFGALGGSPLTMLAGDMNGDGTDDLVAIKGGAALVGSPTAGGVTFTQFASFASALDGALLDANNDGMLDLTVVEGTPDVKVWLGGSGSLVPSITASVGSATSGVGATDLDLDGWQDIAVVTVNTTKSDLLAVLGGSAAGFLSPLYFETRGVGGSGMALEDLNMDGLPDVAIVNDGGKNISVLRNAGAPLFGAPDLFEGTGVTNGFFRDQVDTGDINGDGRPDLVASFDMGVFPMMQQVDGSLSGARAFNDLSYSGLAAIGDYVEDGDVDLMLAQQLPGVYRFSGDGLAWFENLSFVANVKGQAHIHAIELNGDRHLDFMALDTTAGAFRPFFGDGAGNFVAGQDLPVIGTPRDVAEADFDLDGILDLAVVTEDPDQLQLLRGFGPGLFTTFASVPLAIGGFDVETGDLNGDGRDDVVCTAAGNNIWGTQFTDVLVCLVGTGGQVTVSTLYSKLNGTFGSDLDLADVDGDGVLDVLLTVGSIRIYLGDGAGGFTFAPVSLLGAGGQTIRSTVAADLDGDGDVDLATEGIGWIRIFENHGGPPLTILPTTHHPAPQFGSLHAIDWNADGRLDLVSVGTTSGAGTWSLLINRSAPSIGLSNFGTGTGGCSGRLGLSASSTPSLGNAAFALTATHAPKDAGGFGIIGTADTAGSDPTNLGILWHVGLTTPFFVFPMHSDRAGTTHTTMPIPANPMLVGQKFAFQAIFPESAGDACGSSSGLVSSLGLHVTLQP